MCLEPLNQVVFAGSHNSMSSSAYNFFGAEHTVSIPEQLNLGARALLIDAYYGYKDNGIVRTNLAGGANRADIQREFGNDAVKELNRLGALTELRTRQVRRTTYISVTTIASWERSRRRPSSRRSTTSSTAM